ncbi:MAG: patatin-like phospholipase family protein [Gammaproteobacteria bacterium]|nr:patatin-like phospholipase family protein [Gammaproteobacteria bacterium]NIR84058.1 patatin-like phospholipase family protein [Gammaproteobacteria bacterium]NIR89202.1 patatin-like phospholipase family protein [Gammaproteobacteria bacterium]NIU05004.1 patatin-like phospholipase family protein [Gammaproteobacteria bacterium]NIV52170.1 patatin-like phospholipase family protein [Gammaproteobacteria bacterium]
MSIPANSANTRALNLALQGGGAHGAFTWGVLDRLLEEQTLVIEGISGTSAGAMNAAVLADGYEKGGRAQAREALRGFWRSMSLHGALNPYNSGPFGGWLPRSPLTLWFEAFAQWLSPYQLNPFNINPLRGVLEEMIDFDCLHRCRAIKLFLSATNVRTNRMRIFRSSELSVDALLASACLPQIHHAVEIDGEYYWDGGFMGNPVLEPLVGQCDSPDILIVQINPIHREHVPRTAEEINDRVNEISFNSNLMREIRAIATATRLLREGHIQDPRYERVYFHLITDREVFERLGVHSKFDTSWHFLSRLCDAGRQRAEEWLARHLDALGQRSTLDLAAWEPGHLPNPRAPSEHGAG